MKVVRIPVYARASSRAATATIATIALFAATALVSCGGGSGEGSFTSNLPENNAPSNTQGAVVELGDAFAATLSGPQEIPQVASSARGTGTVVVNPATRDMIASLTTSGIAATQAHIQQAPTGANGPIVFPLTESSPGSGIWTARATLTEAQLAAMRTGGFYFNVRSAAFPEGEIRGQITPQGLSSTSAATASGAGLDTIITPLTAFLSALRGTHEVPSNASTAQGAGTLLTSVSTREVIATVATTGIAGTAARIHDGALGVNGPLVFSLTETSPGSGIWTGRTTLTDIQYNRLQAGNMYFNVQSAAFPSGEIRGQILVQRQTLANSIGVPPGTTSTGTGTGAGAGTGAITGTGTGATAGTGMTGTGTTGTGTGTGLTPSGTGAGTTFTPSGTGASGIGTSGTTLTSTPFLTTTGTISNTAPGSSTSAGGISFAIGF